MDGLMSKSEMGFQLIKEFGFVSAEIDKIRSKAEPNHGLDIKDQSDLHRYIEAQRNLVSAIAFLTEGVDV